MKRVSRDIDPALAQDLIERVPRACISFACSAGPDVQPVIAIQRHGRYFIGIPVDSAYRPVSEQEVALLIDEGVHFFDLRAITLRGQVRPAEAPEDIPADHVWFELILSKMVAWDYGMLREVKDEAG